MKVKVGVVPREIRKEPWLLLFVLTFQEGIRHLVSLFPSLSALGLFWDPGSTNSQDSGIFAPFCCVLRWALQDLLLMLALDVISSLSNSSG